MGEKVEGLGIPFNKLKPKNNYMFFLGMAAVSMGLQYTINTVFQGGEVVAPFLSFFCLLWAGILLGVSFIEAPTKFKTATLPREIALDVGRTVFHATNKAEIVIGFLARLCITQREAVNEIQLAYFGAFFLLFLQIFYLQPALDERARKIMCGEEPPSSGQHLMYVFFEFAKFLALLFVGLEGILTSPYR